MRKKIIGSIVVSILLALAAAAEGVCAAGALSAPGQDYFGIEIEEKVFPPMRTARGWELLPDFSDPESRGPGAVRLPLKSMGFDLKNEFTLAGSAKLTETDLGGGSTLTVKADGVENRFSAALNPQLFFGFTSMRYTVKSATETQQEIRNFNARSFELRYRDIFKGLGPAQGLFIYDFFDNNVDDMHYLAAAVSRPFGKGWTGTLGVEHSNSKDSGSETGLVAGARVAATKELQGFVLYRGADPVKFIYNNQFLDLVSLVGEVVCAGCDEETISVGISYQPFRNVSISITGYDLGDLSIPAGSIVYVLREK